MVGKTDLESMLYESAFGAATEMGGFALDKVPQVSLAQEPFWKSIFVSYDMYQLIFFLLVP